MTQLEKDIPEGGLKLTNLRTFDRALKLSWIKRLVSNYGSWQCLFEISSGLNRKYTWELDKKSLENICINTENKFWKGVFSAWIHYKNCFTLEIDPRTYPIFGSYFLTNFNILKCKRIFEEAGVIYLNDLFDCDGNLFGFKRFSEYYQIKLNFVDFYSLMHGVPRNWKQLGKVELKKNFVQKPLLDLLNMKKVCKASYQFMLSKVFF